VLVGLGPVLLLSGRHPSDELVLSAVYVAAAGCVVIASRVADRRSGPGPKFGFVAAGAGLAVVGLATTLTMMATGSSISSLVDGVAIRPLRQPGVLNVPIHVPPLAWAWLVAPLAALLLARRAGSWSASRGAHMLSGIVRVAGGLALIASVLGGTGVLMVINPDGARFALLPLVALVILPTCAHLPSPPGGLFARRALASLAVTQTLHAYPVPGSQVAWGLLLAGVCGVVVVSDGVTDLVAGLALEPGNGAKVAVALGAIAALAVPLVMPFGVSRAFDYPGQQLVDWWNQYHREVRLGLAGTGPLRMLPVEQRVVRATATSLRRQCDTFVAYPSDLKFFVLSGVRPPTGLNATAWQALLTREEQQTIVDALRWRHDRVCVLAGTSAPFSRDHVQLPSGTEGGPLVRYLEAPQWVLVSDRLGYQIVRRASR
jgi:hypothetical protein